MFTPGEDVSSERLTDFYGGYFVARLKADPDVAGLAKTFDAVQEALRKGNEAERQLYRQEQVLVAARDHADFKLDEAVRALEIALFASVAKNRKAKEYKAMFPDGLTAVVAAPLNDEMNAVKRIESQLAERSAEMKKFLPTLTGARQALEKGMADMQKAANDHAVAMVKEMTARREWLRSYRVMYGELVAQFPENRRRVESYFRPRGAEGRAEEPPQVPPALAANQ